MAMAGAYMLAGEVCKHDGDLYAALDAYEERVRPLVEAFQKIPPGIPTVVAPQTAAGIWLRNSIFAILTRLKVVFDFVQKHWASAFADGRQSLYELPNYDWKF